MYRAFLFQLDCIVGAVREPPLQGFQISRHIPFIFDVKLLYRMSLLGSVREHYLQGFQFFRKYSVYILCEIAIAGNFVSFFDCDTNRYPVIIFS